MLSHSTVQQFISSFPSKKPAVSKEKGRKEKERAKGKRRTKGRGKGKKT